jgi:bifunctional non-homologous end joining protein LigD
VEDFLLDGEIVVMDDRGGSDFQLIQGRIHQSNSAVIQQSSQQNPAFYMIFDVLSCQDYDLRKVTLAERRKVLEALLPESERIRPVHAVDKQGDTFFGLVKEQGLEGIVAKDRTSLYREGRSQDWLKIKTSQTRPFVIGGYTQPTGGRKHFGALLVGLYDQGSLCLAGRVGGGFSDELLSSLSTQLGLVES